MSHNNGGVIKFEKKSISDFENFLSTDDDEGGVGGLNCTPYPMKPLVIMSLSLDSCVTSVMNPKP
jgi:hypothetical protein